MRWWVAPVYRQSKMAFRLTVSKFHKAFKPRGVSMSELRVEWRSDSVSEWRSAENYENLRGEGLTDLFLDEAARIARPAWEEVLRPMLADTGGNLVAISTPKGRNWFHQLFTRGQDPSWPEYKSFSFPSWINPFFRASEVEELRRSLPEDVFRQEIGAEFLAESAGVFRNLDACERGTLEPPRPGASYVVGWDVAKHSDASVMMVIDCRRCHVVAFERYLRMDYEIQYRKLKELCELYNDASVLMDSTGVGDPVLERVRAMGLHVQGYSFTPQSKQRLIEGLAVGLQQARLTFPPLPVLRGELEVFEYKLTTSANIRYSAPEGYHDDCVCALALAWWAAEHGSGLFDWYREQATEQALIVSTPQRWQAHIASLYRGQPIQCTEDEWAMGLRDAVHDFAAQCVDDADGARGAIALMEVKRLDDRFPAAAERALAAVLHS